jgi:Rod binding domain-containing protein
MMLVSGAAVTPLTPLNAALTVTKLTTPANSTSPEISKLRNAAGEFESILLESLWKSMKETFSDPDEEADPTLKGFDDWGMQAMASAVGKSGGLGIKNMILKYLEPGLSGSGPVAPGTK